MAATFAFELATPRRPVVQVRARAAQVPAEGGLLGLLPGHEPLISLLGTGPLTIEPESGEPIRFLISGGFLEVTPERALLLADLAERRGEIDVEAARRELADAERQVRSADPQTDYPAALARLELAQARLDFTK